MERALDEELGRLIRLLVDETEAVEVVQLRQPDGATFEVRVAPDDLGKVIGRQGRTVRALRALVAQRGVQDDQRYELEIVED